MEILDARDDCFAFDEQLLLDFNLDEEIALFKGHSAASSSSSFQSSKPPPELTVSFPEFVEDELEWLSNKEAFPALNTCFGILSDNPQLVLKHHSSPISVLENTTHNSSSLNNFPTGHPVGPRTKTRKARAGQHCPWPTRVITKNKQESSSTTMARRCLHCQSNQTPQWRAGPMGPKTLCNACGVRYKSGRLLPEYRPASSPTFSTILHSNSHRKVVEMRRQKQMMAGEGVE